MEVWQKPGFLLGEDDYNDQMNGRVIPFVEEKVVREYVTAEDGTSLAYYYALQEEPKGTVVMLHGFCEFFGKYHESACYFYEAGYNVFFLELRGHGYSDHSYLNEDMDKVSVRDFSLYVSDVCRVMDEAVLKKSSTKEMILFCHSMGGCVGSLVLEEHPNYFTRAVLSSPMMELNWNGNPNWVIRLLAVWARLAGWYKRYLPGQHGFDGVRKFPKGSILSEVRYDYMMKLRTEDEHNQTYGGTYEWAMAAMKAMPKARKNAGKIRVPVLLCTAGLDTMVKNEGQDIFYRNSSTVIRETYENSRHEIFNADEEERKRYFDRVLSFMSKGE